MTYIIAVVNEKGGVGKTTTVVNLGAALADRGSRVLGIDMDPHSGLTISLLNEPGEMGLGDMLLSTDNTVDTFIADTSIPGFRLISAGHHLANAETRIARMPSGQQLLKNALGRIISDYDFIILDCGPSLGLLTLNALIAADGVIIPMQSEYLAMRGVGMLLETVRAVQDHLNPALRIIGFLAAMHDRRTTHARDVLGEMRRLFGDKVFGTTINYTVRLKETPLLGESILTYDGRSQAAEAYRELAAEVMRRTMVDG